jgi:hypothetical protein
MLPEAALENLTVGPNNKPNKGVILKKSVEQIRDLQQQVKDYHLKIKELEATLEQFKP